MKLEEGEEKTRLQGKAKCQEKKVMRASEANMGELQGRGCKGGGTWKGGWNVCVSEANTGTA